VLDPLRGESEVISNERYVCLPLLPGLAIHFTLSPSFTSRTPISLYSINTISAKPADIQIMQLVDQAGRQGLRWTAAIRALEQQSSIPIDHSEFAEVVKGLTDEGVVRIVGERERRTIRRLAD
jgi:CRP-like cAMP-binding protein